MRFVVGGIVLASLVAILATSRSWSQTAPNQPGPATISAETPTTEAITGTPVTPNPGNATLQRDPFSPPDPGGTAHDVIQYEQLSPVDKAGVDRQLGDATNWDQINNAYAAASGELANTAIGTAAGNQLNAGQLAAEGVVP